MNPQDNLFSNQEPVSLLKNSASRKSISSDSRKTSESYSAADIEILEGLEPVRRRPGMYIGGTDEKALHHLFAEVLDNAMDEALAGHAHFIEVALAKDGTLSVTDDGRGIPVDPHPRFPDKSALEIIMTTLHAGGKFDARVYEAAGGLHGVGISVVNALSEKTDVEVARKNQLYLQSFSRGIPQGALQNTGRTSKKHGTKISFRPDPQIFGPHLHFQPERLYHMARSKSCLFGGVKISWACDPVCISENKPVPETDLFHFPSGLKDYLADCLQNHTRIIPEFFSGKIGDSGRHASVEWAISWFEGEGFLRSWCNTIPTHEGGTHEVGLRNVLIRGLRSYGELTGNKRAGSLTAEDIMTSAAIMLSVFMREPEFSGQTKEKLSSQEASRITESAMRDAFDHWLVENPPSASRILEHAIQHAEERTRQRQEKEITRKSALRRLRLPGKLADCAQSGAKNAELFIVEGDSAGGSAKQARDRATQAILPLRGKILNVASSGNEKLLANQQISDLVQALGCGIRSRYQDADLRYERVIIMTDADVDGAHIASLLVTFFYQEMPCLIRNGHLFLAVPPLYRLSRSGKTVYAQTDSQKDELMQSFFPGQSKVEISRFKGLGEMLPAQLRETTMDRKKRTLLKIEITEENEEETQKTVTALMGIRSEPRFLFIRENAKLTQAEKLDI